MPDHIVVSIVLLFARADAWLTGNPDEAIAAATGLAGAYMLASGTRWAPLGWLAFLASNAAWLCFAWREGHPGLFLQQVGFTGSSLLGIWTWLLRARVARADHPLPQADDQR